MSDTYQAVYDAARSRIHGGDVSQAVEAALCDAFGNASHQIQQAVCAVEYEATEAIRASSRPSAIYRPSISRDGNKWCALYGPHLMEGVCGFGDSPAEAMADFDSNWAKRITALLAAQPKEQS